MLRCTQGTQCTASFRCNRITMEHTYTKNTAACSRLSVPEVVELILLCENTRYYILVDVIQTLLCFDDGSSVSNPSSVLQTWSVASTAQVNAGRSRNVRTPANKGATSAAVEQEPWRSLSQYRTRLRNMTTECPRSNSWRSMACILTVTEHMSLSRH
jgi:hypothetical protein